MEIKDYYRRSAPAPNMDPSTEEGLANVLADNARIKAFRAEKDLQKPLNERGDPPLTFMECEEQIDKLRDLFLYDPETGNLYRRHVMKHHVDYLATTRKGREGYGRVGFYKFTTSSANMVWLLHTGKWPERRLKRRDGDPKNDRIENLCEPAAENLNAIHQTGRKKRAQTSRGVARYGPDRWQAYYRINGKQYGLGRYKTEAEALAARRAWERGDDLV